MLQEILALKYWKMNKIEESKKTLSEALNESHLPSRQRKLWIELWALKQPAAIRSALFRFFTTQGNTHTAWDKTFQSLLTKFPQNPTLQYLQGRYYWNNHKFSQSNHVLQQIIKHPYPPIESERIYLLAVSAWHLGHFQRAKHFFQILHHSAPTSGQKVRAKDWTEYMDWLIMQKHASVAKPHKTH